MLCYKDRTFCSFYKECKDGGNCYSALTDLVLERATIWSKLYHPTDILIAQFTEKPDCFKDS